MNMNPNIQFGQQNQQYQQNQQFNQKYPQNQQFPQQYPQNQQFNQQYPQNQKMGFQQMNWQQQLCLLFTFHQVYNYCIQHLATCFYESCYYKIYLELYFQLAYQNNFHNLLLASCYQLDFYNYCYFPVF